MISAIITFSFTHMGILILMPLDQNFSRVGLAWRTLWKNAIASNYVEEYVTSIWISPLYGVLSGLILFALRRMVNLSITYTLLLFYNVPSNVLD